MSIQRTGFGSNGNDRQQGLISFLNFNAMESDENPTASKREIVWTSSCRTMSKRFVTYCYMPVGFGHELHTQQHRASKSSSPPPHHQGGDSPLLAIQLGWVSYHRREIVAPQRSFQTFVCLRSCQLTAKGLSCQKASRILAK